LENLQSKGNLKLSDQLKRLQLSIYPTDFPQFEVITVQRSSLIFH